MNIIMQNQLILNVGGGGAFDSDAVVMVHTPIKIKGVWYGFYIGVNAAKVGQIGLATSQDGMGFTKSVNNPVIPLGTPGSPDQDAISAVYPVYSERLGRWYVFYIGQSLAGLTSIMYASGHSPDSLTKGGALITTPPLFATSVVSAEIKIDETLRERPILPKAPGVEELFIVRYTLVEPGGSFDMRYAEMKLW